MVSSEKRSSNVHVVSMYVRYDSHGTKGKELPVDKYVDILLLLTRFIDDQCVMLDDPTLPLNLTNDKEKDGGEETKRFKEYHWDLEYCGMK